MNNNTAPKMNPAMLLARKMKEQGMENLHYLPMCDNPTCRACKKLKNEKAPWNK
jgi:hypothetical protein